MVYAKLRMIQTANLKPIPCELQHFEPILNGSKQGEQMLGVTVLDNRFDFLGVAGIEAMQFAYEYLKSHPDAFGWWTSPLILITHLIDHYLDAPDRESVEFDSSLA